MAQIDFLPFAFDAAADVLDQADYLNVSVSTWRQLGFSTGTALSQNLNKVWRQASLISAMVANFSSDATGADMIDDGSTSGQATLLTNFQNAVKAVGSSGLTGQFLPLAGGTLTGPLVINAGFGLTINAPGGSGAILGLNARPGQQRIIGAQSNGAWRWQLSVGDTSIEGGSNQGSNFVLYRFTDAGAYIDAPLAIARNTGIANFTNTPTVAGGPLPFLPITGGVLQGPMTVGGSGISYAVAPEGAAHHIGFGWSVSAIAAELMIDGVYAGLLATEAYVGSVAGAYLPLAGGVVFGNLSVDGGLYGTTGQFSSSVIFGGRGDFSNYTYQGNCVRQWMTNWYDIFMTATGARGWAVAGGTASMWLDASGNLTVPSALNSNNGRIIAQNGAGYAPSVTCYSPYWANAMGMWIDSTGLWWGHTDGNGNPITGQMRMQSGGVLELWSSFYCYYQGNFGDLVYSQGQILLSTDNSGRVSRMGMSGSTLYWYDSDGSNWYANTFRSDPKFKRDIRKAADFDSLGAICALPISAYAWNDSGEEVPHGFISTDLRAVGLADAVRSAPWKDDEVADHLEVMPMLAHLCRAVAQLNARLDGR